MAFLVTVIKFCIKIRFYFAVDNISTAHGRYYNTRLKITVTRKIQQFYAEFTSKDCRAVSGNRSYRHLHWQKTSKCGPATTKTVVILELKCNESEKLRNDATETELVFIAAV